MTDDPQAAPRERLEARLTAEREALADLENAHHAVAGELAEAKSSRAFQALLRAQQSLARLIPRVRRRH